MTIDRTHVLATPGLDSHASYVAMSRHRVGVILHYSKDDFADSGRLARSLSRERGKDMALDYANAPKQTLAQGFAERRGITFRERAIEIVRKAVPEKARSIFSQLRLPTPVTPQMAKQNTHATLRDERRAIVQRHAHAVEDIFQCQDRGDEASKGQLKELRKARKNINAVQKNASLDFESAYRRDRSLAPDAASGNISRAVRNMQLESEIRADPTLRANRFVERWQRLDATSKRHYQSGDMNSYHNTRAKMGKMAKSLERDPQMESVLAGRKAQLGITFESGRLLGAELAFNHGIDLGRGRGHGL